MNNKQNPLNHETNVIKRSENKENLSVWYIF